MSALLHGLYHRRVMGSHKPTTRRMVYTVFQLETHAWTGTSARKKKKKVVRSPLYLACAPWTGLCLAIAPTTATRLTCV